MTDEERIGTAIRRCAEKQPLMLEIRPLLEKNWASCFVTVRAIENDKRVLMELARRVDEDNGEIDDAIVIEIARRDGGMVAWQRAATIAKARSHIR